MSRYIAIKLKTLLLLSAFVIVGCSTSTTLQCPEPSADLKSKSADLKQISGPDDAADVIRDNGKIMMHDRDRLLRWQEWWSGCKKGA